VVLKIFAAMAKTKPSKKSKKRDKSILNGTTVPRAKPAPQREDPAQLLTKATELLQTSQPGEALPLAQKALSLLQSSPTKVAQLPALNLVAEISLELGDADSARNLFLQAAEIDPDGSIPETNGGGSEKFLWLAQLSEEGGMDSVGWFEKGVRALKSEIAQLEGKKGAEEALLVEEKKGKLARALCGVVEIYMTDLSCVQIRSLLR
jgi:tetratricopeptide (TPR) repeat protein